MDQSSAIREVGRYLGSEIREKGESRQLEILASRVNELLTNDFDRLISILYRMDVSEEKIRRLLDAQPTEEAGKIIARLMIERELQRIRSRNESSRKDPPVDENERW